MRRPFLVFFTVAFLLYALSSPGVSAAKGGKSKAHRNAKLESGEAQNDGGSERGLTRALERDDLAVEGGHGRVKSDDSDDSDNAPKGKGADDSGDDGPSPGKGHGKGGAKGAAGDD